MGAGLIAGMGYLAYALLFTLILCAIIMICSRLDLGARRNRGIYKTLHITIPEDLDYTEVFDDLLGDYTSSYELTQVRTTNMGSLFRLTYDITLREAAKEKQFIDQLRCRNGNLEISISNQQTAVAEL